jgi:hypothetical protein
MAPGDVKKLAQSFLKDQAEIIKKHGNTPKLSGQNFKRAMNDTTKTFAALKAASAKFTTAT